MNCKNCGAPLRSYECEYCGTIDFDLRDREQHTIRLNYSPPTIYPMTKDLLNELTPIPAMMSSTVFIGGF